ncbi:WRKY transcription factor 22-like [Curcuma longa]|uniref:WRKY transcription factor 22-like n=1 Tax=Curcuma longa TaxID=136217 RepID=UPI003D9ED0BF
MDDDNWDLSAVVRSCRSSWEAGPSTRDSLWVFPRPLEQLRVVEDRKDGAFMNSSEVFKRRRGLIGIPQVQPLPRNKVGSLSPLYASVLLDAASAESKKPPLCRKEDRPVSQTPRSRRRKNKQKKVVHHVAADGLSSDLWAWRKYGQKPIKGSPYPRGYYRCSSSKGCAARKQVERSRMDPEIFIVTYSSEHNHPMPTHRNSLAGSTRPKLPSTPTGNREASSLPSTAAPELFPTTPLSDSILVWMHKYGEDGVEDEEEKKAELLVDDMEMMGEDDMLFMSTKLGDGWSPTGDIAALFNGDDCFDDHPLCPLSSLSTKGESSNTTTTAGEAFSGS